MIVLRTRRIAARVLLAAVVFAQAAYALAACESADRSPAAALAESGQTCHDPQINVNLCVSHCLSTDQTLDKPDSSIPSPVAAPMLRLERWSGISLTVPSLRSALPVIAQPPPRILFSTLLI